MEKFLSDLPTFVTLAQTGSISKAAQILHVPRSTVSRRLKRLEEEFGFPLFERSSRRLRLTPSGKLLMEEGSSLLFRFKTLQERVFESQGGLSGLLRISSPPGLSGPFIGLFINILRKKVPGLSIDYVEREDIPNLIEEGFDLALASGPLEDSPWVRHFLGLSRYMAVASPQYLNAHTVPRSTQELAEHSLLSIRSNNVQPDVWPLQNGERLSVRPHMVSNDLSSLLDAAIHGVGIALLPFHLMFDEIVRGRLRQVLSAQVGCPLKIYVLYAQERRKSPIVRAFLNFIDQFGEETEESIPEMLRSLQLK